MTNADRIRSMTDDELYEFLSMWEMGDFEYAVTFCDMCIEHGNELDLDCDGCRRHWLTSSADSYNGISSFLYFKTGGKLNRTDWIPEADRLPETDDKVLCCKADKRGNKSVMIGYYMDGAWRCGMNSNVIAWMPLPAPHEPTGTENQRGK